jgi:hypothetical protein
MEHKNEENGFQKIDTFTDLLKHFQKCLKVKGVKERPDDLGYFFMEAINEVLPKKHIKIESPEAIEAIKKEWEKIITVAKRTIWRERKKGGKEVTYGGDPNKFVEKLKDTEWGLQIKTKVRLPSDKFLSQKIKIMPSHDYEYEMEPSPEDWDYVVLDQINLIEKDPEVSKIIDREGGENTADVFKLLIKYRPVKISAKTISEKLGIPQRTVERRIGWIKRNEDHIEQLLEAEIRKRNPDPFISSLLEERC